MDNRRELDWGAIYRFIGLSITAVVLVTGGFVYWAATHPGSAWKTFVQPRFFSKDTRLSTQSATFKVTKVSWGQYRIEWVINGLQVDRAKPLMRVNANLKVSGALKIMSPNTEFHIEGAEFIADSTPVMYEIVSGNSRPKSPFQIASEIREMLELGNNWVRLDKLNVSVKELQISSAGGSADKWQITAIKPGKVDPLAAEFSITGKRTAFDAAINSSVRLDQLPSGAVFLRSSLNLTAKEWNAKTSFDLAATEAQILSNIKGTASYGAIQGALDTQFALSRAQMSLKGKSDIENIPGPVPEIKNMDWHFELPLADNQWFGAQPGKVAATGPVALQFVRKEYRDQLEAGCKCKFPDKVNASVEGSLWPGHILTRSEIELPVANVKVNFESISNSMMTLKVGGQFTMINDRHGKLQYWPVVETTAKFLNFQSLKGVLEMNKIVVPAPFDILTGTIDLTSKATISPNDKGIIAIPVEAKVALSSPSQKVNVGVNLSVSVTPNRKNVDVYANFSVEDLVLELPPVDPIHGIPKIAKDARLLTQPPAAAVDEYKVQFIYDVRTSKPGAIRLLSKLAKPAIPISVDVDRSKAGDTRGIIKGEPFELNYLHRTLFVDGLRIILDDRETADFAVDGRLRMEQSQYKVNIIVSGTIRSPLIKLTSEPELSRSEIISVILYDRTSDQLVAADRETVGTFDNAVADRAIGLLGLWVFASTPIRSFHYNPATKTYTASVNLSEGTTASLGTDWEEAAQVEVRKRVTKQWVLTASWKPGTDEKAQSGKLVLQWEKRF